MPSRSISLLLCEVQYMWGWPLCQVIVLDNLSVLYWSSCDLQDLKRIIFCYFILQKKVNPLPSSSSYLSCIQKEKLELYVFLFCAQER